MTAFDADLLATQLAQLGRDLQTEVLNLRELELKAVELEARHKLLDELHNDALAQAYLENEGAAEMRKAKARLACLHTREKAAGAWKEWQDAKAIVRFQNANLSALGKRIEVGRSLLSREKVLIGLGNSGVDV